MREAGVGEVGAEAEGESAESSTLTVLDVMVGGVEERERSAKWCGVRCSPCEPVGRDLTERGGDRAVQDVKHYRTGLSLR